MSPDLILRFAEWWLAHVPGGHKTSLYTRRRPLLWKQLVDGVAQETPFPEEFQPKLERYMERYYITPRWLSELPFGVGIFLHRFHEPDEEGIHDHPFDFVSICLSGGYVEETFYGLQALYPGRIIARAAEAFHRITAVENRGGTWTLVIHGPRRKRWGFLRPSAARGFEVWNPK